MKSLRSITILTLLIAVIAAIIAVNGFPVYSAGEKAGDITEVSTKAEESGLPQPVADQPETQSAVTAAGTDASDTEPSSGTADAETRTESSAEPSISSQPDSDGPETEPVQTAGSPETGVSTDKPRTSAPITTGQITTAPVTTVPATAAPITTVPVTTVPVTTVPVKNPVRIGISYCTSSSILQNCISSVNAVGGEAVKLSLIKTEKDARKALQSVDALIMTGGEDIDPSLYGEEKLPGVVLDINAERDKSDFLLLQAAIDADMPVLCICRGMQVLNVVCGGTLYQDIPSQLGVSGHRDPAKSRFLYHNISITKYTVVRSIIQKASLKVNSWHHQSVKDPGQGLSVSAKSADGIIEAIELQGKQFIIGVQFHPEKETSTACRAFFTRLLSEGQIYADKRN